MIPRHITSLQHPLVKHLVKLRQDKEYRQEENAALISGTKLVNEIAKHSTIKILIATQGYPGIEAEETVIAPLEVLKKITGLQNPEGIAAVVNLPKSPDLKNYDKLLVLDQLSDPGNLGTLLRTALALGWEAAFLTTGSADPFNEKAIRSAKGATFRLPLRTGSWSDLKSLLQGKQIFVADLQGQTPDTLDRQKKIALVLGNEARGVSPEAKKIGTLVSIPMTSQIESLNVASAGAILMYILKRE